MISLDNNKFGGTTITKRKEKYARIVQGTI